MRLCVALDDFSEEVMGSNEWRALRDLRTLTQTLK